jgi:P-type Ca2+ transporter type 2C
MHVSSGNTPLTAVQLLWVNMIMDTLGALALATEPPNNELMKRTPVGRKGNFISNIMWRNILGQALYQFMVIWYLQTEGKRLFGLVGDNSDLVLNTLIFNCFVFCQVNFHVLVASIFISENFVRLHLVWIYVFLLI